VKVSIEIAGAATIAGVLLFSPQLMSGQKAAVSAGHPHDGGRIYFPYSPGIIPSDLDSEVQRVTLCGGLYEHFLGLRICGHSVGGQTE
jgi:hypothetical protein